MAYNFLDDLRKSGFYNIFGNPEFYAACNGNGCNCHKSDSIDEAPEPDDFYDDGDDWRAQVIDGQFILHAIATGCENDDCVVKVNKDKGILIVKHRIADMLLDNDEFWFVNNISVRMRLPKHIDYKSFHKEVKNGVLIVTADIVKPVEKKDEEITVE